MKIKDERNKVKFADLEIGDAFIYHDLICIKSNPKDNNYYNTYSLSCNTHNFMLDGEMVTKVYAELVLCNEPVEEY